MSTLRMKPMKGILYAVTGVRFDVGLHDFINNETVFKFMITDNNKQLCYLDKISLTLKQKLCECYHVVVDIPTTRLQLFTQIILVI